MSATRTQAQERGEASLDAGMQLLQIDSDGSDDGGCMIAASAIKRNAHR